MRPINVWAPHFYTFEFKAVDTVPCSIWFARIVRVFSLKKLFLFLRKKKHRSNCSLRFILFEHPCVMIVDWPNTYTFMKPRYFHLFIVCMFHWALPFVLSTRARNISNFRSSSNLQMTSIWHKWVFVFKWVTNRRVSMCAYRKKRFNVDKLLFDFQFALKSAV